MGSALLSFENKPNDFTPARSLVFQGCLFTFHADSAETKGQFALLEVQGTPGTEPPLHVHANEDELFYVLEGTLKVRRGNQEITLCAGESAFLPRRVMHTFKIVSKAARFLAYITPGGFEEYFRDLGQPVDEAHGPAASDAVSIAEMIRVAERYSMTFMP